MSVVVVERHVVAQDGHGRPEPPTPTPQVAGSADLLHVELSTLASELGPDEAAYLAATGPLLDHLRDRLAWRLHRRFAPSGRVVARDWRALDLVLSHRTVPELVVQCAAMHTCDVLRAGSLSAMHATLRRDLARAARIAPEAEVLALGMTVQVGRPVAAASSHAVRYSMRTSAALEDFDGDRDAMRAAAARQWSDRLDDLGPIRRITIGAGTVWGYPVDVDGWLLGPV